MPIEIRELNIRVNINETNPTAQRTDNPNERRQQRDASSEALVKECVEQLLRILQSQKER